MRGLSLILPTYNERENLAPLVKRIRASLQNLPVDWEILVVDDGSPDGTAHRAEELGREFPLRVLNGHRRWGLARSVAEGFRTTDREFLLVMDADLSHPPERIPAMWDLMTKDPCDLVIGSRYVPGGAIRDWTPLRRLTSRISKLLVCPLTAVKDPLSGFFLLHRRVIENGTFRPAGFKILLEILARGEYETVREVPITFEERLHGSSKLSHRVILAYLLQVLRLYVEKTKSLLQRVSAVSRLPDQGAEVIAPSLAEPRIVSDPSKATSALAGPVSTTPACGCNAPGTPARLPRLSSWE